MTTTVLRRPIDAYAVESKPAKNTAEALKLALDGTASDEKESYLFFGGGPRPGVFVVQATLSLFVRGTWTGTPTLTVRRIIEAWKESTITWKTKPDTTATDQVSVAPGAVAAGDRVDFDVTQMVRTAMLGTGAPFFGFRVTTTGSAERSFYSSEHTDPDLRPFLTVVFTSSPTVPFDLVPGDGGVVSISTPVLAWAQYDVDGDDQQAFQVQIDPDADEVSPAFDTGWVTSGEPELDLADTAYAGLSDGNTTSWRVRTQDETGQESEWSEWAAITRVDKGTLTIDAPTSQVYETTPTLITTLTEAQASIAYTLEEQQLDGSWVTTWETGRVNAPSAASVAYEFEVPAQTLTREVLGSKVPIRHRSRDYRLTVRSWDTVEGRVFTPGDPPWVEDTQVFQWVESPDAGAGPTLLTLTQEAGGGPGVVCSWSFSVVPDYWMVLVDGEVVIDKVSGLEWSVGEEEYEMTLYVVEPRSEHTIEIAAVTVTA